MTDPYAWHRRALAGENPPVHSEPECGWFLYKAAMAQKGTPARYLPASIYWEPQLDDDGNRIGDDLMRAEVGGAARDPEEIWPYLAKRPVSKNEYDQYLEAMF